MAILDVGGELLADIQTKKNEGLAVGNQRFKDQIELLTGRRIVKKKGGRETFWVEEKKKLKLLCFLFDGLVKTLTQSSFVIPA